MNTRHGWLRRGERRRTSGRSSWPGPSLLSGHDGRGTSVAGVGFLMEHSRLHRQVAAVGLMPLGGLVGDGPTPWPSDNPASWPPGVPLPTGSQPPARPRCQSKSRPPLADPPTQSVMSRNQRLGGPPSRRPLKARGKTYEMLHVILTLTDAGLPTTVHAPPQLRPGPLARSWPGSATLQFFNPAPQGRNPLIPLLLLALQVPGSGPFPFPFPGGLRRRPGPPGGLGRAPVPGGGGAGTKTDVAHPPRLDGEVGGGRGPWSEGVGNQGRRCFRGFFPVQPPGRECRRGMSPTVLVWCTPRTQSNFGIRAHADPSHGAGHPGGAGPDRETTTMCSSPWTTFRRMPRRASVFRGESLRWIRSMDGIPPGGGGGIPAGSSGPRRRCTRWTGIRTSTKKAPWDASPTRAMRWRSASPSRACATSPARCRTGG